jgi:hypothetical protein
MALACLDTLVGLSKTEYACFTDNAPEDFDTSDSGYHLTDTDYGLTVIEQCALEGWTLLAAALAQAIAETKTDLRAKLRERYDGRLTPFSGLIGKIKSTGTVTVTADYIGVRIRVKTQIKGAKLVIRKIYLGTNTSGAVNVTVTSNDPLFTEPAAEPLTMVANTFASVTDLAIELPLWSENEFDTGEYLEYYITAPRNAAKPLNNTFTCCGSTPEWMQYFWIDGMTADDTDGTNGSFSREAMGFAFDAYLTCEELDWICDLEYLNGYHLLDVIARTIQFRGAAVAISALIDSIQVNPCTGYQLEALNSRRTYLNQRYADNIAWIAENMPDGVTDCFSCKPQSKFSRTKMLV